MRDPASIMLTSDKNSYLYVHWAVKDDAPMEAVKRVFSLNSSLWPVFFKYNDIYDPEAYDGTIVKKKFEFQYLAQPVVLQGVEEI